MLLYRITLRRFAEDLSGRGAQLYGGRWNPRGMAALYTAETPAQALLEYLPHFPETCVPPDLALVTIGAPDDLSIEEIRRDDLPRNWNAFPPPAATAMMGGKWLQTGSTAALRAPSVMLPFGKAWNLVLNPAHHQNARLEVVEVVAVPVDARLTRKG